jgi:hypothetical protein
MPSGKPDSIRSVYRGLTDSTSDRSALFIIGYDVAQVQGLVQGWSEAGRRLLVGGAYSIFSPSVFSSVPKSRLLAALIKPQSCRISSV